MYIDAFVVIVMVTIVGRIRRRAWEAFKSLREKNLWTRPTHPAISCFSFNISSSVNYRQVPPGPALASDVVVFFGLTLCALLDWPVNKNFCWFIGVDQFKIFISTVFCCCYFWPFISLEHESLLWLLVGIFRNMTISQK